MPQAACLGILPHDVKFELFLNVPDFKTLSNFFIASRSLFNVFTEHEASIIKSVLGNEIGPAWLLAVQVDRCDVGFLDDLPDTLLTPTCDDDIAKRPIAREDVKPVLNVGITLNKLEALLSVRSVLYHLLRVLALTEA